MEHLVLTCTLMCMQRYIVNFQSIFGLLAFTHKHIVHQRACAVAGKRNYSKRVRWSEFSKLLSDSRFRRHFRMDRDCFSKLCDRIEKVVGEEHFMSEEFLDALETSQVHKRRKCV